MSTPEPTDDTGNDASAETATLAADEAGEHAGNDSGPDAADTAESTESATVADAADDATAGQKAERTASDRFAFLPSPLFVLLIGVTALAGYFSWTRAEVEWTGDASTVYLPFVFILGGWIASLAIHEYAHALVAYRFGDRSLRGGPYLRLNPFRFRQLFAGLLLPLVFLFLGVVGLTGPALYVDRSAVPSRGKRTLIALSGIAASLLLAVAFAVAVRALVPPDAVTDNWMIGGLMFLCYLNLTAALVNLLPIPGTDGFDAIAPYLPQGVARQARDAGLFGVIAIFAVLWFPEAHLAFLNVMYGLFQLLGLPQLDIGFGEFLFQFWLS
ncbi:site-2 protease family protein [Nocardiopsis gilva YIM 90087]|uniref:Site-2 protease family protein n=1 Tax=Nocardiopsis gilva YIM 90087 TaxID=1235441 RepID=A0A223S3G7_9ACTN|nr:site-2 protease family protein [Nocardiopsis gilva]ASU82672.1 site-2 protease family protein [Nocardiopsis gilva YIM 90087]